MAGIWTSLVDASESLVDRLTVLEGKQEVGGAVGIACRAEDFVLVSA